MSTFGWLHQQYASGDGGRLLRTMCAALIVTVGLAGATYAVEWEPYSREEHDGCTAGAIAVGSVIALDSAPYWHCPDKSCRWRVSSVSDVDCHDDCPGEGMYSDHSESYPGGFTCDWTLMTYNPTTEQWEAVDTQEGWDLSIGVNPSDHRAGYYYLIATNFDDTPDATAGGEDFVITSERLSSTFTIVYPYPVNWRRIFCAEDPAVDGVLKFVAVFDSACGESVGHLAHLAHCEGRELVDFPGPGTEENPDYYFWPLPGSNPLMPWHCVDHDPGTKAFTPAIGGIEDYHEYGDFYSASMIGQGAAFSVAQYYQYRTEDMQGWHQLAYYGILREVEEEGGGWVYTCTKDGASADYTIP